MVVSTSWWTREAAVVDESRAIDQERTSLCDDGMSLLDGLALRRPAGDGELVQAIALVQARNTLAVAWEAAFAGYAAQAMALCRVASEYLGVAWYAEDAPSDIAAWLTFDRGAPRRAGELLCRVLTDEQLGPSIREMRRHLQPYIHADTAALGTAVSIDEGTSGWAIDGGPTVDARRFKAASFFLILLTGLAVLRAVQYVRNAHDAWATDADAYLGQVGEWLERVQP